MIIPLMLRIFWILTYFNQIYTIPMQQPSFQPSKLHILLAGQTTSLVSALRKDQGHRHGLLKYMFVAISIGQHFTFFATFPVQTL